WLFAAGQRLPVARKKATARGFGLAEFSLNFVSSVHFYHSASTTPEESTMHPFRILSLLMAATLALFAAAALQADERNDPVSAQDFVEEASAKGIAEIEVGRLALEKSTSQEVKTFAQRMIDDHTKANEKLAALASEKKLEVS